LEEQHPVYLPGQINRVLFLQAAFAWPSGDWWT